MDGVFTICKILLAIDYEVNNKIEGVHDSLSKIV
jgi:hypothetical protein